MTAPDDDVLTAALRYVAQGWHLLPVRGKRPASDLCPRWSTDSTTDPAVIVDWFAGSTGLGIGLDLGKSGLVVVDGDHLDRLDLPPELLTGWAYRGNPARRSWLFGTDGANVPQAAHPWGEVKSGGGYVVLPPSPHDVGGRYQWADAVDPYAGTPPVIGQELAALIAPARRLAPDRALPPPVPDGDVTPGQRAAAEGTLRRQCDSVAATGAGGRNHALNAAAVIVGHYVPHYLGRDVASAALLSAAERSGLVHDDGRHAAESTIRSGLDAGMRDPETLPGDVGNAPAFRLPELPADFWSTPTLRTIRDAAHSNQLGAAGVVGGVLARASMLTGHNVMLQGTGANLGTLNMFVGLVMQSGGGKGASGRTAERLLPAPDHPCACGSHEQGDFITLPGGSGEGLTRAYYESVRHGQDGARWERDRHHVLFDVDEIESLIAIAGRSGATIGPVLRSLWSSGTAGFQNASADRRFPLNPGTYRTALLAGVQPAVVGRLFDESMGGTPQRFLWIPAHGRDVPNLGAGETLPDWPGELAELPRDRVDRSERIGAFPDPEVLRELQLRRNQIARGDMILDPLDVHRDFMRLRVAALLGRLHNDDRVTGQWWDLAGDLLDLSDATRAVMLEAVGEQARSRSRAAGRADHVRKQGAEEEALQQAQGDARSIVAVVARHADGGAPSRHKGDAYTGCPASCIAVGVQRLRGQDDRRARAIRLALDSGWLIEVADNAGDPTGHVAPGESRPA